ncbi:MAG: FHA domain-containing protein [Planctomycetaceae bacterium]
MRIVVEYSSPNGIESKLEVAGETIKLGRHPDCEIMLDAEAFPKVSRFHASIEPDRHGFYLIHRSKSNHTLLNSNSISERSRIKTGDTIRLGFTGPELIIQQLDHGQGDAVWNEKPQSAAISRSPISFVNNLNYKVVAWAASGVAALLMIVVIYNSSLMGKTPPVKPSDSDFISRGNGDEEITDLIPAQIAAAKREEEIRSASIQAWKQVNHIETDVIGPFDSYNYECAKAIAREYNQISTTNIEPNMKLWISELIEIAEQVVDLKERKDRLDNQSMGTRLLGSALEGGVEEVAEEDYSEPETVSEAFTKLGVDFLNGAIRHGAKSLTNEITADDKYNQEMSKLLNDLKKQHERLMSVFEFSRKRYSF